MYYRCDTTGHVKQTGFHILNMYFNYKKYFSWSYFIGVLPTRATNLHVILPKHQSPSGAV